MSKEDRILEILISHSTLLDSHSALLETLVTELKEIKSIQAEHTKVLTAHTKVLAAHTRNFDVAFDKLTEIAGAVQLSTSFNLGLEERVRELERAEGY